MKPFSIIRNRLKLLFSKQPAIKQRWSFALRRALAPQIKLSIWVTSHAGAQMFLGNDIVDEFILEDLCGGFQERYFPPNLSLADGDVVLDLGAHHGLYAVELFARFPRVTIVSIEPDSEAVELIHEHIAHNSAERAIAVVPLAIGPKGAQGFLRDNNDGSWGKTVETTSSDMASPVEVTDLEEILQRAGIEQFETIRLIKSNCEGGEYALVPQMIALKIRPEFLILMIHPDRGDESGLVKLLEDYGYSARKVTSEGDSPCYHFVRGRNSN